MALVLEQNPDKDIRMLFMRNNKINKASKTKYSDWCDKRGIAWSTSYNGEIPEEWITDEPKIRQPKEEPKPKRTRRGSRSLDERNGSSD